MIGYTYPLLDLFWTMLWIFCFIIYIWVLIAIFTDIFRSHDIGGVAKALWVVFIFIVPLIGILAYLIARGHKMTEHQQEYARQQDQAFKQYVQEAAGGSADQLAKLAELKDRGVITDAEFESQKAKLLA